MSNLANIIERILDESRQEADAIRQEHRVKAEGIKAQAEADAQKSVLEIQKSAELEALERKRRSLAVAELDARKRALAAQQDVIDEAFAQSLKALGVLAEDKYRAWIMQTALEAAESGDEQLLVNAKDRPLFESMLDSINKALSGSGKKGALTLSADTGGFVGGMVLIGQYTEKNCTFETLLRQEREEIEADVASILFG